RDFLILKSSSIRPFFIGTLKSTRRITFLPFKFFNFLTLCILSNLDNLQKLFGIQAVPSDQESVRAAFHHKVPCVLGIDRTAVDNPDVSCYTSTEFVAQDFLCENRHFAEFF